jgi:hypothetical protein
VAGGRRATPRLQAGGAGGWSPPPPPHPRVVVGEAAGVVPPRFPHGCRHALYCPNNGAAPSSAGADARRRCPVLQSIRPPVLRRDCLAATGNLTAAQALGPTVLLHPPSSSSGILHVSTGILCIDTSLNSVFSRLCSLKIGVLW